MKRWNLLLLAAAASSLAAQSLPPEHRTDVVMKDRGASTFYVDVYMTGATARQFLVDTGSSYTTINEDTLTELLGADQAEYFRDLEGVMANGARQVVPVYTIKSLTVGENCAIRNVQAAVFPGSTRNILGLSALRNTSPFVFSIDPPVLSLSNCRTTAPRQGQPPVITAASGE